MTVHHMLAEPSCSVFKLCLRLWASPNTRVCRLGPMGFHQSRSLSQWRRGCVIAVAICLGDGVTNGNKCVSSSNDLWVSSCLCPAQVKQTDQAEGGGGRGSTCNSYYFQIKHVFFVCALLQETKHTVKCFISIFVSIFLLFVTCTSVITGRTVHVEHVHEHTANITYL